MVLEGCTLQLVIIATIFIALLIGYKCKNNTGVVATVFAYLIGCYIMGMRVREIVDLWPIRIMFLLLSVTLFYGYAVENGTLKIMADKLLYKFKDYPKFLPFGIFITCLVLAGTGAGAPAVGAFMAPIVFAIALETGMHPVLASAAVALGGLVGSNFVWSQGGVVFRGIIDITFEDMGITYTTSQMWGTIIAYTIIYIIFYFIYKGYTTKKIEMEKPGSFNPVQKKNFIIIMVVMGMIIIPIIVDSLYSNPLTDYLIRYFDIQMLAMCGALLCAVLKLGTEKTVIKNQIPWATIIMICGFGMLVGVANVAGLSDTIGTVIGDKIPIMFIGMAMLIVAALMSMFSSALSVVIPMMVPMVPEIAAVSGLDPAMLVTCIIIGAGSAGFSPFSTGGSLVLSGLKDEELRDKLIFQQLMATFLIVVILAVLALIGLFELTARF